MQEQIADAQYRSDKQIVDNFFDGKSKKFDYYALKRLITSELAFHNQSRYNRICGFSRTQIQNMIKNPEVYSGQLVQLSRFMMLKSGYYKRLIEYFVNMGMINWTIDTEVMDMRFYSVTEKQLRANYIKFAAQCNKFRLDENITNILRKMFVEDVCFGFWTETEVDASLFFLDPRYCEIQKIVNGNVYQYAVNRSLLTAQYIKTLPTDLQILLEQSATQKNNMVLIPYEKSLCLKYNHDFTYTYPPFFNLIADILLIEDMKELNKAKTESDAYKLIYFKIPTTNDGQIAVGDEIVVPFVEMAKQIVPETWGVVPAPMELELVESRSTTKDDVNKVQDSVENYYSEAGVSKALISSASSGSELKLSMKVDSSDLYRIYRQLQAWVELQMKLRGFIYKGYGFKYNILPMTIFDIDDTIDRELKLAQVSVPNKGKLLAANGINTAKMLGLSYMENVVLADVLSSWKPLQTSYTTAGADLNNKGGRPTEDDTDIAESTALQRENDSNSVENRI